MSESSPGTSAHSSGSEAFPLGGLGELWRQLEVRLANLLRQTSLQGTWLAQVLDCRAQVQALNALSPDAALFLHFQRAQQIQSNYSASHALICALVCHQLAQALDLPAAEQASLLGAALTMNVSMTALQDQLATQLEPMSEPQRQALLVHAVRGRLMLASAGVNDELWLDTVAAHHEPIDPGTRLEDMPGYMRLPRLLQLVDRFTATISPRQSRAGLTPGSATKAVSRPTGYDDAAAALTRTLGVFPPGTYVQLVSGEAAVVVRRGVRMNQPWVASVIDRRGSLLPKPRLHETVKGDDQITGPLLASVLRLRFRSEEMLALIQQAGG